MLNVKELAYRAGFIGDRLDNTVFGTTQEKAIENLIKVVQEELALVPEIKDRKEIWIVENNTDLTEGRGCQYAQYVCEKKSTAIRLAKKAGIQGADAFVVKGEAVRIGNHWYAPRPITVPSKEDLAVEAKLEAEAAQARKIAEVLERAKALGLSDEDLKTLRG